jgi:hypothetical protein
MTIETKDLDFLPFDFVYAGRRALKGNKPGAEILRIVDGRIADSFVFEAKSLKGKVIGGIYRGALFTDTKARGLGSVTFVERWNDQGACIDWRARDDAFEAQQRLAKLESDAKKVNELEALLLPLRKQYAVYVRQYDSAGKEALELALLRALRTPPRKVELN